MPGFKVHDATGNPHKMYSLEYRKGLNAPDWFKQGRIKNIFDYNRYFKGCDINSIPTFEDVLDISSKSHFMDNPIYTNNPNLNLFINTSYIDLNKWFWQGYFTHLVGDKVIYNSKKCCNNDKFKTDLEISNNTQEIKALLHRDWDITNSLVDIEFNIPLLPEIEELGIVKYLNGKTTYINSDEIIKHIYLIRELTENIDISLIDDYFKNDKQLVKRRIY